MTSRAITGDGKQMPKRETNAETGNKRRNRKQTPEPGNNRGAGNK